MRVESSSSRLVQLRVASVEHKRVDHGQRLGWFVERHHVARTSDAEPSSLPTVPLHHVSAHPSLAVYCPRPPRLRTLATVMTAAMQCTVVSME